MKHKKRLKVMITYNSKNMIQEQKSTLKFNAISKIVNIFSISVALLLTLGHDCSELRQCAYTAS